MGRILSEQCDFCDLATPTVNLPGPPTYRFASLGLEDVTRLRPLGGYWACEACSSTAVRLLSEYWREKATGASS